MNDDLLTDELAARVMGWRLAPGRYIKPGRSWTPRWKFAPLSNLAEAFRLLEAAHPQEYMIAGIGSGEFCVRVRLAGGRGEARSKSKPRAVTYAIARAVGIELENPA
jgi:hypothetical protein